MADKFKNTLQNQVENKVARKLLQRIENDNKTLFNR